MRVLVGERLVHPRQPALILYHGLTTPPQYEPVPFFEKFSGYPVFDGIVDLILSCGSDPGTPPSGKGDVRPFFMQLGTRSFRSSEVCL